MNRRARRFVECACLAYDRKDDHRKVRKATHILEQMPGLASHSIYTAAAADVAVAVAVVVGVGVKAVVVVVATNI